MFIFFILSQIAFLFFIFRNISKINYVNLRHIFFANKPDVKPVILLTLISIFLVLYIFNILVLHPLVDWDFHQYYARDALVFFNEDRIPLTYPSNYELLSNQAISIPAMSSILYMYGIAVSNFFLNSMDIGLLNIFPVIFLIVNIVAMYTLGKVILTKSFNALLSVAIFLTMPLILI